jgi:hypothetical protein
MVTLPLRLDFGTCLYQCFASNCTPISLNMLKCLLLLLLLLLLSAVQGALHSVGSRQSVVLISTASCDLWHWTH